MNWFARIRSAAEWVADHARFVRIDSTALERLAGECLSPAGEPAVLDPAHHHLGTPGDTLAYIVTLDAINFGSGWFPLLRKRPGCSGYFTVATALKERFERDGALSASELRALDADAVAKMLGQMPRNPALRELMEHFARALRHLGTFLHKHHGGCFEALVRSAEGSAERLARELTVMPYYRDVARYEGLEVPLYKRAQLTVADLATAFGGEGPGRFEDLAQLTMFADNLVPHVLRCAGALVYEAGLGAKIDAGQRIAAGSREEVEIRAVGLHAVECMVRTLRDRGDAEASAQRLDSLLWNRGQDPAIKAIPRHRTRSVFY